MAVHRVVTGEVTVMACRTAMCRAALMMANPVMGTMATTTTTRRTMGLMGLMGNRITDRTTR